MKFNVSLNYKNETFYYMDFDFIKIAVTIFLAVIGWIIGHYFTIRKDRIQKRTDISTEYLIKAYRILTMEVSHRNESKEWETKLENILSDIQLFRSISQVEMAKDLADTVASGSTFELDPLINSLRNDVRKKLGLSKVKGNLRWLRFYDKR